MPRARLLRLATLATAVTAALAGTATAAAASGSASIAAHSAGGDLRPQVIATTRGAPVLGGFTSRGWPVTLVVGPNARRLQVAATGLDMICSSGGSFAIGTVVRNVPIKANGNAHAASAIPPFDNGSGVSITGGSRSFSGHLDRRHWTFSGVWHVHIDFATSSGRTDHCDSGNVGFSARL